MARLVNFFAVKGQRMKGYIIDSVALTIHPQSSMEDYFRGRSEEFEDTLSKVEPVTITCFIFVNNKLYRVADFGSLQQDDEVYVCEHKYKQKLEAYLVANSSRPLFECSSLSSSSSSSSSSTTTSDPPSTASEEGCRKRKREDSLLEKLQMHERRKQMDPNYNSKGSGRQQFIERETIDVYRRFKAQSMVKFDENYGDTSWKKCKCLL